MSRLVQTTLSELSETLERENAVWVRVSADFARDEWTLRLLEMTSGDAPPRWQEISWRYPDFLFRALEIDGAITANWLLSGKILLEGIEIPAPFHQQLLRERRESGWGTNSCEPLAWPSEEWRLSRTDSANSSGVSELVSATAPYYDSPDMAIAQLLGVPYTGYNNSSREFVFRQQDRRGRLVSIRVDAAEVSARVDGEDLAGAVVELAGTSPGPTHELDGSSPATVPFPLPNGLPELPSIVLRSGEAWLDRRSLSWPTRADRPGVEYVVAPDNRLEALVAGGETSTTEFKKRLPEPNEQGRRKVMKTVAAFANGAGGTIIFGVTDEGAIVGLSTQDDEPEAEDNLTRLITSWVHPLPHFRTEPLPVPDAPRNRVIALIVDPGEQPPYAAGTTPDNMTYYVRRSATTFAVMPGEVRALAQRNRVQQTYFPE
jgi:hypothetical protein